VSARTGLVGHPSDAFGGAVLAMPVPELAATLSVEPSSELRVGHRRFVDVESLLAADHEGDSMLLTAAIVRLVSWMRERGTTPPPAGFAMRWNTTIPRAAGLAGSSALVIGALRSLARSWEIAIPDCSESPPVRRIGSCSGTTRHC
jgi:glucuronokinase